MNLTKIAVVGLVLLAVLFFSGIGVGRLLKPNWNPLDAARSALEERLIRPLDPAAISANCMQGRRFQVTSLCVAPIPPSSDPVRRVRLRLVQGASAEVRLTARLDDTGDQTVTAKETLDATTREVALDVYKDGGALTLVCPATCVVELR